VGVLAAAVRDELEAEGRFARCFDACVDDGAADEEGSALRYAARLFEREIDEDLQPALSTFVTIEAHALEAIRALSPLAAAFRSVCGEPALPQLQQLCANLSAGWCTQLEALLAESIGRAVELESWEPISGGRPAVLRSSSVVDLFTQLDQLCDVFISFASLQPLQPADLRAFTDVVERKVGSYVRIVAEGCVPLPASALEGDARRAASAVASDEAPATSAGRSRSSRAKGAAAGPPANKAALEAQPLEQLCLRLNNCAWAREQLGKLASKLVASLPDLTALARTRVGGGGVDTLMAGGASQCDAACDAIAKYVARKVVYYELGSAFLTQLYLPSPLDPASRLAPLLTRLNPTLAAIVRGVALAAWSKQALLAVLGTFSLALTAVLEAPNRRYAPAHRTVLLQDVQRLADFFMDGGLLDEQVVAGSVSPLRALVEASCAA